MRQLFLFDKNDNFIGMKFFIGLLISLISTVLFSQNKEKAIVPLPVHSVSSFMENKGQWDEDILFKSSFKGGNLWVQRNKLLFHLKDFEALRKNHVSNGKIDTTLQDRQHVVHLNFRNSNEIKHVTKSKASEEYYNFFLGKDERKWTKDVHTFTDATLHDIYTGIDIHLIQDDEQLKYEFIVSPFTNSQLIELEIAGADKVSIDQLGRLKIETPLGSIIENKPYVYQVVQGNKIEIKSDFVISREGIVQFKLGKYDNSLPLIIDPVLVFATYCGSVTDNFGMTATYGHDGTAYSGGTVFGNSYPTPDKGVFNIKSNFTVPNTFCKQYYNNKCIDYYVLVSDVFISKYSNDGSKMLWTAFLGGGSDLNGNETVHSLICDDQDNIYGFGATSSIDFPTTSGCFQNVHHGGDALYILNNGALFGTNGIDIFAFKISANGHQLVGSTLIGGSQNDGVNYNYLGQIAQYATQNIIGSNYQFIPYDSLTNNYGDQFRGEIFLDSLKNIIIATSTRSSDFPIVNGIQSKIGGKQDGIILKLKNDFTDLLFSTYIGGSENDALNSLKVSHGNQIIFCGGTSSNDLKTTPLSYQKNYGGGKADGFIGVMSYDGKQLNNLSYLGLNKYDQTYCIESDIDNNIYVVGHSIGGKFLVKNASYSIPNSTQFIAKFDSSISNLLNSTLYGNGNPTINNVSPVAFLVDDCYNIYVSGWGANVIQNGSPYVTGILKNNNLTITDTIPGSVLNNMPLSSDAFQKTTDGYDFHLFVIDKNFSKLVYGSYIGGNQAQEHVDGGTSRFDKKGVVYQSVCGGCGGYSDFPVTANAWSKTNNSDNCNNLVFKYDFELVPSAKLTSSSDTSCLPINITYTNSSTNTDGFVWDLGNGKKDSLLSSITKTYTKKGNYTVKLLVKNSICNLIDTTSFTSAILDTIRYVKLNDMEVCDPIAIKFNANSYGTANSYCWSLTNNFSPIIKKSADSTLTFLADSSQWLFYKASNGYCEKIDSVYISVISPSLKIIGDTKICVLKSDSLYSSIQSKNQTFTFDWSPKKFITSHPSANSVIVKMDTTQTIYIQATGDLGCIAKDSLKISFKSWDLLNALASADKTTILKGDNVKLYGKPDGYSYIWTPESKVNNSQLQNTEATVWENTIYTLKVSDDQCTVSDTILIHIIPWDCDFPYVFVPNAFSPNSDGENDVLFVRGHPIKKIEFRVFNRWGEKVFESFDINQGWDGTYKGKLVDPDVFDYYLNVECIGEEHKQMQGNITVLR